MDQPTIILAILVIAVLVSIIANLVFTISSSKAKAKYAMHNKDVYKITAAKMGYYRIRNLRGGDPMWVKKDDIDIMYL